ncbi:PAP2 superfamily protein, partial [Colletotrichum limetticola]
GGGGKGGDDCKGGNGGGHGGGGGGGDKPGGDKPGGGGGGGGGKGGGGMTECNSFRMRAKGSVSGWVGQLESGQLRIGLEPVILRMEKGEIVDTRRRGMWWTPPTETLQCDPGQKPDKGWSVGCDGKMTFQEQTRYFQCEAENQTYNLYKKNDQGVNCGEITLYMSGCGRGEGMGDKPPGGGGDKPPGGGGDKPPGGGGGGGGHGGGGMSPPANGTATPQNGTKPMPPPGR